jgi:glycerophosphoryl diester phosphodiesterase
MEIIAHRGASHDAPENTLAAARLAWAQQADALEVDVHLTRDRRLAVIHDPDTLRTAGVARAVPTSTLAELQTLDIGRGLGPTYVGERIPALGDILALVPAGRRVFVELKGGPEIVPALVRSVQIARNEQPIPLAAGQIAVIAFNLDTAAAAKRALPEHEVCWLADASEPPLPTLVAVREAARAAGLDGIDVDANWPLDRDVVQQIRRDGFKLYVWTVDDVPNARRLSLAGVDGLTTNRPGWLRRQLATP